MARCLQYLLPQASPAHLFFASSLSSSILLIISGLSPPTVSRISASIAILQTIENRYGPGVGSFVGNILQEGGEIIRQRVAKYNIDCDLKAGNIFAACHVKHMRELGPNTYFAHGYSGHGVTGSHLYGRILAEAVDGDSSRFDVFSKVRWFPFPGGRMFREQYCMIGSWWYGMRDAFGV